MKSPFIQKLHPIGLNNYILTEIVAKRKFLLNKQPNQDDPFFSLITCGHLIRADFSLFMRLLVSNKRSA